MDSKPPIVVTTRAIIIIDDKLLICKLKPHHDFWCLPGGRLESGETLVDGFKREIIEETGIQPIPGNLLYINQFLDEANHRVEFFFGVKNAEEYLSFDHTKASHGHEIAEFKLADPSDGYHKVLPAFLMEQFGEYSKPNFATRIVVSD